MLLAGSNIQTQTNNSFEIQAVFSVTQCIFYDSTFRHRKTSNRNIHSTMREPPLPIYVGLLLHGETCKRSLVDKFYGLDYQYQMTEFWAYQLIWETIHQNFTNQKV